MIRSVHHLLLTAAFSLAAPEVIEAQTSSRQSCVIKGGVTIERSEDNVRGTVPAGGVACGTPIKGWIAELEFWVPARLDLGPERTHRDTLVSAALVRPFGRGRLVPHALFGASLARTEDSSVFCSGTVVSTLTGAPQQALISCDDPRVTERAQQDHSSSSIILLAGGGLDARVSDRVSILAEVRLNGAATSLLVRPAAGVRVRW
jgi:hypothetical protein